MNSKVEVKIGPDVEHFLRRRFDASRRKSVRSLIEAACQEIATSEMRKAVHELDLKENAVAEGDA
jgi:hypothetical protein